MDIRDTCKARKWWISIDEGNMTAITTYDAIIPIKYDVCPVCNGRGYYVNPNIDRQGLDTDESPDFIEDYYNGVYDITCQLCGGCRVIPVCTNKEDALEMINYYNDEIEYIHCRNMGY